MLRNITKLFVSKNGYYYFIINYLLFIYLLTFDSLSLYISLCLLIIMQIICKLLYRRLHSFTVFLSPSPHYKVMTCRPRPQVNLEEL